jgi:undecaprenyl-diphosphatase
LSGDPRAVRLLTALAIAFTPAAVMGLLFRKIIKANLFGPLPVALALALGGIAMIVIERVIKSRRTPERSEGAGAFETARRTPERSEGAIPGGDEGLEHVTSARALAIGLAQCVSLWPGASRAMCTIVAGQLSGLSTATAAEFSFLLALPTLGAATLYEAFKSRHELASVGAANMAIGLLVSFFTAWAVIASFLRYLRTRGLEAFGWYRIVLSVVVLWALHR